MNFSNKQKLYFNVLLLFVFAYVLTTKIISGIKTQDFDYLRIGLGILVVGLTIKSIIKYNSQE